MDMYGVAKPGRFEKQIAVFCAHLDMDVVGTWIDEFEGSIENFGKKIARKALEDIEVCPVALSGKPPGYYV